MARPAKAWYWKARDGWYSTVRGGRVLLARGKGARDEARRELHRLLGSPAPAAADGAPAPTVDEVAMRFHDRIGDRLAPATVELYRRRLDEFRRRCGPLAAADVRPLHVNEWLEGRAWSDATKRTAVIVVRRMFSWATKEGYLDRDPVAGLEKPAEKRREAIPSADDVRKLLGAARPAFREFLEAIGSTGCRPGEAMKVEAKDFDPEAGTWTIDGKTTRKTGRKRVVYLTPSVLETCRRLAARHPTGPLFRNAYGLPWTIRSYGVRLRRLRERLGLGPEVVAYGLRHLWITDALAKGVPIATVAELAGHKNTVMISKHYSHLSERADHLRAAAMVVRPGVTPGGENPAS